MTQRALHVEPLDRVPVQDLEVEIVERKGAGHPDSLIDGAAESVSKGLCKYYLKEFDTILHHNVDKGLLVGGRSNPRFAGGQVVEPIYILVAGRATSFVMKEGCVEYVPVGGIAVSSIKEFLKTTMRYLDTENHAIVDYKIKQGSVDLVSIFTGLDKMPLANDTSIGVGYAPLSPTEKLVLEAERLLNSRNVKSKLPELGEDIKVMALRKNRHVDLTVAVATISSLIPDRSHYISVMEDAKRLLEDMVVRVADLDASIRLNAGDDYDKGRFYLTVTGTSAESGDDGNTGRGNRANGLIAPIRQYSMEATAGKNPVNHTGKLFNVAAQMAADKIFREIRGLREVYVRLLSKIGAPIDMPQIASAAVVLEPGVAFEPLRPDIENIIDTELSQITNATKIILDGSATFF